MNALFCSPHDPDHKKRVLLGYLYDSGQLPPAGPRSASAGMVWFLLGFVIGSFLTALLLYLLNS